MHLGTYYQSDNALNCLSVNLRHNNIVEFLIVLNIISTNEIETSSLNKLESRKSLIGKSLVRFLRFGKPRIYPEVILVDGLLRSLHRRTGSVPLTRHVKTYCHVIFKASLKCDRDVFTSGFFTRSHSVHSVRFINYTRVLFSPCIVFAF